MLHLHHRVLFSSLEHLKFLGLAAQSASVPEGTFYPLFLQEAEGTVFTGKIKAFHGSSLQVSLMLAVTVAPFCEMQCVVQL